MHPPLYRPHPKCEDYVNALVTCHAEFPFSKFMGYCNDDKAAMDICFRKEKEEARFANMTKARSFDDKFEEHLILLKKAREHRDNLKIASEVEDTKAV